MCLNPTLAELVSFTNSESFYLKLGEKNLLIPKGEILQRLFFKGVPTQLLMRGQIVSRETIEAPCRKCVECRLFHVKQWSYRLQKECEKFPDFPDCPRNLFVTLTMNDENYTDSLQKLKVMFQLFMKRLRHNQQRPMKYFVSYEHGGRTFRAHAHAIIYNCILPDVRLYKHTKGGFPLYTSELLTELWGHGFAPFGRVTSETAAYCASYSLKKCDPRHLWKLDKLGLEQPFMRCSQGIGFQPFFNENYEKEELKNALYHLSDGRVFQTKIPRLFLAKLEAFCETSALATYNYKTRLKSLVSSREKYIPRLPAVDRQEKLMRGKLVRKISDFF